MQLRYQCYVYPCFFTLTLSLYHRPFYSTLLTDFSHMLTYSHTSSVVFVFIPSLPFPSVRPSSPFLYSFLSQYLTFTSLPTPLSLPHYTHSLFTHIFSHPHLSLSFSGDLDLDLESDLDLDLESLFFVSFRSLLLLLIIDNVNEINEL
jgi:hypothetical protein